MDESNPHNTSQPSTDELYVQAAALYAAGQHEQAADVWREVLRLDPTHYKAHNDLGAVLDVAGQCEEAEKHLRESIRLAPTFADAIYNLGLLCERQRRFGEAIDLYRRAIAAKPEMPNPHLNLAMMLLTTGDLAAGLAEYEWRWTASDGAPIVKPFSKPEWRGQDITGQTLLVYADQGLGDTLHFARFCKQAAARCGRLVLMVQPSMVRLMRQVEGVAQVLSNAPPVTLPPYDWHVPLLSLPHVLGTTMATIPADVPYLRADVPLAAAWGDRLARDKKFRIGITWAGRPEHHNDKNRSATLKHFAPLLAVPGVTFYSLQKGPTASQLQREPIGLRIVNCDRLLVDFFDSAAVLRNLDLVISVDTSIVHLAGAMGKPVWTLVPFVHDWRWFTGRSDSPWYPTMRLFRQERAKDWESVFEKVREELTKVVESRS